MESRAVFAVRQRRWCADGFIRRGSLPEAWVLVRGAGLRADLAEALRGAVSHGLVRIAECLRPPTVAA